MYSCNEFYSLSVLSLFEGELIGSVDKIYFDKKLKKILQIELLAENDIKLILPIKNIYKIGKNAIIIKNAQAVSLKTETEEMSLCPIDSKAYSINGEFLGVIKEIIFNNKFLTQKIVLDNGKEMPVSNLASCGKNTVIFNMEENKINVEKFMPPKNPKLYKGVEVQAVEVQPIEIKQTNENIIKEENINSNFLLGRVCKHDIYNFNNELLIKANGVVNKKILKEIKRYGKLRELMLFCK